jgi:hypothetical protein
MSLHRDHLDAETVEQTIGCILKVHEDRSVLDSHREAVAPILGDEADSHKPGGYGLDTDFGIGSVTTTQDRQA